MVQLFYTSDRVSKFGGVIILSIEWSCGHWIYRMDDGIMSVCAIMQNMYFPLKNNHMRILYFISRVVAASAFCMVSLAYAV